jgi:hypothetical protein
VTVNNTGPGTPVMARLLLQPDADTVVMIDTAYAADPTLSDRVQDEINRLMAELDSAQTCVHAVQQVLKAGGTAALALLVSLGGWGLAGLVSPLVTATAFPALVLTLRPLLGWALRRRLAKAAATA